MPTPYNSTIKLYAGVPLVKGGTEVLYLGQGAAEGALSSFLKATYTEYYFVRDNRRAVQIDAPFGSCDDVNYISFTNLSHGGKIFFGFVDNVVYINDNCTEIQFTIDPFPTYLTDTEEAENVYIIRNTYKNPSRGSNFILDYNPNSAKKVYTNLYHLSSQPMTRAICYFAAPGDYVTIGNSGIKVDELTPGLLKSIQEDGGVIIGAYMDLSYGIINFYSQPTHAGADITFNPLQQTQAALFPKINTGLYNDLLLITSNGAKQYDIEDFGNPLSVTFGRVYCMLPSPMVFLYPKNYRGVSENIAEGVAIKVPSIPISANATYTDAQFLSDAKGIVTGTLGGAIAGGLKGGVYGAALGAITGAVTGIGNMAINEYATQFKAPTVIGRGEPMVNANGQLVADFVEVTPAASEQGAISNYFDYYGYQVNAVWQKASINTDDEAFLQVGSDYLHGSEADDELNARIMAGIKIRKTLT